jgi:phasin family protein
MSSITEQFSAATKSQLEAQFHMFSTLASTAVDSAQKVIALNLSTTKASVEKSSAAAKKLLAAKDPQEFFSLSAAEPASFDKLLAYGRELYGIASTAQAELIKSAQGTFKQVTDLAATPATVLPKTPPALAAAVSAAVTAIATPPAPAVVARAETAPANEPVAVPPAKAAKAPAKPKPAAAPIAAADDDKPVQAQVAAVKPSFPAPPPKPIALGPESKPAKLKAVAPKAKPAPGKQLDILSHGGSGKGKK